MTTGEYTGPTSGRITVKGDEVVKRETFTRETDPPLTRDELIATEDFRALPPNEQIREYRLQKWNAAARKNDLDQAEETAKDQEREITELRARLAVFTPEGYQMPPAAALLLAHAADHGWRTARAWHTDEGDGSHARLEVAVTNGWHTFQFSWSVDPGTMGGHGRMIHRGLARKLQGPWQDAPSLIRIQKIITEENQEKGS